MRSCCGAVAPELLSRGRGWWAAMSSGSCPGIVAVSADRETLLCDGCCGACLATRAFFVWDQKHDDFRKHIEMRMSYFEKASTQNLDFHCLAKGGTLWLRCQMVSILPPWSPDCCNGTASGDLQLSLLWRPSCGGTAAPKLLSQGWCWLRSWNCCCRC